MTVQMFRATHKLVMFGEPQEGLKKEVTLQESSGKSLVSWTYFVVDCKENKMPGVIHGDT